MYWLVTLMTLGVVALIATGLYLEFNPSGPAAEKRKRFKGFLVTNLGLFAIAELGLLALGTQEVMAATEAAISSSGISTGLGLAMIGIGLPTGLATVGAGIAVGPVGAAALAVISEKPEYFGRTLVYLGLAEGIAIYGVVISILLLNRL